VPRAILWVFWTVWWFGCAGRAPNVAPPGPTIELANGLDAGFHVADAAQHRVITMDQHGSVSESAPGAEGGRVRLDVDRRVVGREVTGLLDQRWQEGRDEVLLRLSVPSEEAPDGVVSVRPIVSRHRRQDVWPVLRVGRDASGKPQLNGVGFDADALLFETTRRLRAMSGKYVDVEIAPDRPWEQTVELVVLAVLAGCESVRLIDASDPPLPPPPPPAPQAPAPREEVETRGMHHSQLEVKTRTLPIYPEAARDLGLGDQKCLVEFVIGEDGTPTEVVDVQKCPAAFHASARETILAWRWYPPKDGRTPVRAQIKVALTFKAD
jgi:hypothetical protein